MQSLPTQVGLKEWPYAKLLKVAAFSNAEKSIPVLWLFLMLFSILETCPNALAEFSFSFCFFPHLLYFLSLLFLLFFFSFILQWLLAFLLLFFIITYVNIHHYGIYIVCHHFADPIFMKYYRSLGVSLFLLVVKLIMVILIIPISNLSYTKFISKYKLYIYFFLIIFYPLLNRIKGTLSFFYTIFFTMHVN